MAEKKFTTGMIIKAPRDGAPDFVKAAISIKVAEFIPFLEVHAKGDGWVNIDVKEGKSGKWYGELNVWTKEAKRGAMENSAPEEITQEDLPF